MQLSAQFAEKLCGPVWKKGIGKYWIQYFFREFPILYCEKSIRILFYQYLPIFFAHGVNEKIKNCKKLSVISSTN